MKLSKQILLMAGLLHFAMALFQVCIGFSPSLSLYFGAPESLVANTFLLICVSFTVAAIVTIFGLYAISGAGVIRALPWLKQALVAIGCVYIMRGLLLLPEFLVIMGMLQAPFPIATRFVVFSAGSLAMGFLFIAGALGAWHSFPSDKQAVAKS